MKPHSPRLIVWMLLALVAMAGVPERLARAQPALAQAIPGAVAPGKTTEVSLRGTALAGPLSVWTSFPAQVELLPGDPKAAEVTRVECKVTVPAGVAPGIGGIVVGNAKGISEVLCVLIDDLPTVAEKPGNESLATAQEVQLPAGIDGRCDGVTFDYYRFAAKAGERISCELVATRLGWDFDPVVRLLDGSGAEVLRADDDPATGADARLAFKAPADGQFVLEIRDNRYKAGGRYRLRLGNFALATTASPLAIQAGTAGQVGFSGPQVEGVPTATILAPMTSGSRRFLSLAARAPSSQGSGWGTLLASDLPVVIETASPQPDDAAAATLPAILCGTLEAPKDRDLFTFTASKGTSITFRAITRSAGSAAVLVFRLLDAQGTQIAESPITDSDEPLWTFAIPAEGTYKLAVDELASRGGPDYAYAVEARPGPQFSLGVKVEKTPARLRCMVPHGEAFHIDVTTARQGYDGPITLAIDSPRAGWQVFNNVIPPKAAETRLIVVAPPDLTPGELVPLRVVGSADASAGHFTAALATTTQLRTARPQMPYPPAWIDGVLFVCGMRDSPPFYSLRGDKNELNFPRPVGQTQLSLAFERIGDKFKDPITIYPLGLPAGVTAEIKRNGNGPKETYDVLIKGPKDLAEGAFTFRYVAYGDLAGRGIAVQSGDIRVNVINPVAVVIAPAGPLVAGKTQKVKLTLTRLGDDQQPVDVKFKSLPAGVTAPENTTLAADQNEVEIELTAAADAAPIKFEQLIAVATGKYAGVDLSVESPAAALEVKAP
ncbi:MAG: PPC domain-containing protein [Pirellulaceae bacterium]|nr:PPC domain-containing protein [Pirellulaceae bacterium]